MFKRRRDRTAERARCSSWVVGARNCKAASIGGLFHTKPAMTPIGRDIFPGTHLNGYSAASSARTTRCVASLSQYKLIVCGEGDWLLPSILLIW
jgi:hypothetical protein